jgi:peptidyl-tRNA hydrolase, PTH1 family
MGYAGLVVGLGNPGKRYALTRHNVGFAVIDRLLKEHTPGAAPRQMAAEKEYLIWRWQAPMGSWILAKPQTYMNLSGNAVHKIMSRHSLQPRDLLVVHDELDLPLGRMKLKLGGGLAGHKGLKSIAASIGSQEFHRLRIGISRPLGDDVTGFVLSRFREEEEELSSRIVREAALVVETFISMGFQAALQRANSFIPQESGS